MFWKRIHIALVVGCEWCCAWLMLASWRRNRGGKQLGIPVGDLSCRQLLLQGLYLLTTTTTTRLKILNLTNQIVRIRKKMLFPKMLGLWLDGEETDNDFLFFFLYFIFKPNATHLTEFVQFGSSLNFRSCFLHKLNKNKITYIIYYNNNREEKRKRNKVSKLYKYKYLK